jgi:histidinol-phosphatase (PHP family)
VPITLGSDAHHPREVGMDFDRAVELLRRVGYTRIATYERRRRKMVSIAGAGG